MWKGGRGSDSGACVREGHKCKITSKSHHIILYNIHCKAERSLLNKF